MKTQVSLLPKDTNTLCEKICAKSSISFHVKQLAILHQIAKLLFSMKISKYSRQRFQLKVRITLWPSKQSEGPNADSLVIIFYVYIDLEIIF